MPLLPPAVPQRSPLRRLWPFLYPYRGTMIRATVALTLAGSSFLIIPAAVRYVIDRGVSLGNAQVLNRTLLLMLGAILVLALATFARYTLVTWLGERVIADLRRAVYAHLLDLSPAFYESARSGDILSRLSADTGVLQSLIGSSISVALRNIVLLIGGVVMMARTSPRLTGMVMLVIPAVVVPLIAFGRRVRRLSKQAQDQVAALSARTEETMHGIRTVQASCHEQRSRALFDRDIEAALAAARGYIGTRGMLVGLVIFMVLGAICVILWIGGHDLIAGRITSGQLSAFILYAVIAASSTAAISEAGGDLQRAAGATERLFELLNIEPDVATPAAPVPLPVPARGGLVFEDVTFFYPSRPGSAALADISFTVVPGARVAIVGPSGAGKSTLLQLALRFYDPQKGRVLLDGVDAREADLHVLRSRIALVPQDPVIFSGSARMNILFGRTDASTAEVEAAARAAHAHEFLTALPDGYNTYLGEKGVRLSGGQRQRIVIARAILRDAPLLLLDEATSALDTGSERLIQDALNTLMRRCTTLIIAHRLSTVIDADRILVMDQGRIVATGTHRELLAASELYAGLARLQFGERPVQS